jgi:Uma2 family endonuclease
MSAVRQAPELMSLVEFLVWDAPDGGRWQLVDGEPRAMAPASDVHGTMHTEIGRLIGNHLAAAGQRCRAVANPGVRIGIRSDSNCRIPDLGVTCAPSVPGAIVMPEPLVLIEILSPSNPAETWINVWAYLTIPTVHEVLVVRSDVVGAQLLRRNPDGSWPQVPHVIETGDVTLDSIGFRTPLTALYTGTWLADAEPG